MWSNNAVLRLILLFMKYRLLFLPSRVKPVLRGQTKVRMNMNLEDRRLPSTDRFTIKMIVLWSQNSDPYRQVVLNRGAHEHEFICVTNLIHVRIKTNGKCKQNCVNSCCLVLVSISQYITQTWWPSSDTHDRHSTFIGRRPLTTPFCRFRVCPIQSFLIGRFIVLWWYCYQS